MSVLGEAIAEIMMISGAIACAIVDIETGECLARFGVSVAGALETASRVNARMLRAKMRMAQDHGQQNLEDILITLGRHYHIIRLINSSEEMPSMFIFLTMDRAIGNLAMARHKMALVEQDMIDFPDAHAKLAAARARALQGDDESHDSAEDAGELPPFMRDDVAMKLLGIDIQDDSHDPEITF